LRKGVRGIEMVATNSEERPRLMGVEKKLGKKTGRDEGSLAQTRLATGRRKKRVREDEK